MSVISNPPASARASAARVMLPLAAVLGVSVLGWQDLDQPVALAILGLLGFGLFLLAMRAMPLLLFWAAPVLIVSPQYLPVLPYEALIVLIALPLLGGELVSLAARAPRLDAIQWRYALFLLLLLPGALAATSGWRYLGQIKLFVVGWLAFEVARRAVPRFGRETLLWGPALFCAATLVQLLLAMVLSGVPLFKSVELRTWVTDLGWMHANGIPSIMLLCAPSMLLLVRLTPARSWQRVAALAALVSPLVASLLVAARGPFLLSAGYLLFVALRGHRSWWLGLGVAALITTPLLWTPMGQGLAERFTDPRALESTYFRVNSWSIAWQRGATHLPWGIGAGQGVLQNDALLDEDPHNFALTLFSENGPLATLAWFWMMFVLWRWAGRARREGDAPAMTALRGTLFLGILNSMFEPTLKANQMYHLFWWNLGLLEAGRLAAGARAAATAAITPAGAPLPSSARPTTGS